MKNFITKKNVVKIIKISLLQTIILSFSLVTVMTTYALLSYPTTNPDWATTNGSILSKITTLETKINNMSAWCNWWTIYWFSSNWTPICSTSTPTTTTNTTTNNTTNNTTTPTPTPTPAPAPTPTIPDFIPYGQKYLNTELKTIFKNKWWVVPKDNIYQKSYRKNTYSKQKDKLGFEKPWYNWLPRWEYQIPLKIDSNYAQKITVSSYTNKWNATYSLLTISALINWTVQYCDHQKISWVEWTEASCSFNLAKDDVAYINVRHACTSNNWSCHVFWPDGYTHTEWEDSWIEYSSVQY